MDRKVAWLAAISMGCTFFCGCGGSEAEAPQAPAAVQTSAASQPAPDHIVAQFLEAVRTGKDDLAEPMLTDLARKKTAEMDIVVAPTGSDTASYQVKEMEYLSDEAAHVLSTWTDVGPDGKPRTDEIIWVLKRESVGWRIAGMITKVFPDMPPLALNFENPEEMQKLQENAEKEMQRRAQQAALPAGQGTPNSSTR